MENLASENYSGEAANDDGAQESIIQITSIKLTENLLKFYSVKQRKAFQPRFCGTPAAVGMKPNVGREKERLPGKAK
jgi:hypothetical protein